MEAAETLIEVLASSGIALPLSTITFAVYEPVEYVWVTPVGLVEVTALHLYPTELEAQLPADGAGRVPQEPLVVDTLFDVLAQFHQKL